MIQTVAKPSIAGLLAPDTKSVFKVPRYQREYTWGKRDWENLFDDLMDNGEGYFLGSVIVIDHGLNPETGVTELEVVDGQQRLTTVSILLCAIYSALSARKAEFGDDEDLLASFLNLKKSLVMGKTATRVVPQAQGSNLDDYRLLLSEHAGLQAPAHKPKNAGLRRIYHAYRYFAGRLDSELEGAGDAPAALFGVLSRVRSAVVVQIGVSTASDAYTLFESLNNRGVPLTAVDLIKNTLMANYPVEDDGDLDLAFDRWQAVVGRLGDDYQSQERFFRYSYDAFRLEANAPFATEASRYPLGPTATRSNLLSVYERQIRRDPEGCLRELECNSEAYERVLGKAEGEDPSVSAALADLANAQGTPAHLLLLRMFREQGRFGVSDSQVAELCGFLSRFFVRRNLTDIPPTRDLTRIFTRVVEEIVSSREMGEGLMSLVRSRLAEVSAPDAELESRLRGPVYETNVDSARYVLATLAAPSVTNETRGLWERYASGAYVWTIEHVFPQGANIPQAWVNMVGGGDPAAAAQIQAELVHSLGNLTLTGYNSALGNLPFEAKKTRKDAAGNYVGYLNGLSINSDLAVAEHWDADAIRARTNRLVAMAMEALSLGK